MYSVKAMNFTCIWCSILCTCICANMLSVYQNTCVPSVYRALESLKTEGRNSRLWENISLAEVIKTLEDLIEYFAPPGDELGRFPFLRATIYYMWNKGFISSEKLNGDVYYFNITLLTSRMHVHIHHC